MDADRRNLLLRAVLAAALAAVVAAVWLTGSRPGAEEIRGWGDDLGWSAAVIWPPLFGLIVFFVPWPIVAGATGVIFGTVAGTPLAVAGVLWAAALEFSVARHLPTEGLRMSVMSRIPRISAMLERSGFWAVFYTRLLPLLPWGVVNYGAGFAKVRLRDLLLATLAAGVPKVFAYTALGGSFGDVTKPEAIVAIALLVALGVLGLIIGRKQLRQAEPAT